MNQTDRLPVKTINNIFLFIQTRFKRFLHTSLQLCIETTHSNVIDYKKKVQEWNEKLKTKSNTNDEKSKTKIIDGNGKVERIVFVWKQFYRNVNICSL